MVAEIKKIQLVVRPILKRAGVIKTALFGSYARGDFNKDSDIDFLVEFKKDVGLFGLSALRRDLECKLERRVDLFTFDSVSPLLRQRINKEQIVI